jgi:hypothetical protein
MVGFVRPVMRMRSPISVPSSGAIQSAIHSVSPAVADSVDTDWSASGELLSLAELSSPIERWLLAAIIARCDSWSRSGRLGRCTTTSPAAWKNSPMPRWRRRVRRSSAPSAKHWREHRAQEPGSAGSSTWSKDPSRTKNTSQAARSPRPRSSHPSSALACASSRHSALTNGNLSSLHASGTTAGQNTQCRRPPRRSPPLSKEHYSSPG